MSFNIAQMILSLNVDDINGRGLCHLRCRYNKDCSKSPVNYKIEEHEQCYSKSRIIKITEKMQKLSNNISHSQYKYTLRGL